MSTPNTQINRTSSQNGKMLGELVPKGGGDSIPLLKESLLVGRRESCDIVLRFANVSAHHCELSFSEGYLYVLDRQSRNGTKVNGKKVGDQKALVQPGDELAVAKHRYEVVYSPFDLGAEGPPPQNEGASREIMERSLLSKAGLEHTPKAAKPKDAPKPRRYDPTDQRAGQIDLPDQPV